MKTNFHTHNYRCGHAIGNVEDYVKVAVKEGYSELGISDHAPVPGYYNDRMKKEELQGYLEEIEEAQKKYKDKIKIYKSLEIEYFPEWQEYYDELKKKLDYIVLGLHAFRKEGETEIHSAWSIK
ncbi:MAG: PHP domain-containing protein, partial [Pseudoleptotrichia goodfellowii]|nr:PHP domain-containing protein [Pseudoleptotrichia goodfellowii]